MDISNKTLIISNESYIPWYNSKNVDKSREALNKMLDFCKEKNFHLADYLIENCSDILVKPSNNTGILKSSIEPASISNYANLSNLEEILDRKLFSDFKNKSVVYSFTNMENCMVNVGSSINIENRMDNYYKNVDRFMRNLPREDLSFARNVIKIGGMGCSI